MKVFKHKTNTKMVLKYVKPNKYNKLKNIYLGNIYSIH